MTPHKIVDSQLDSLLGSNADKLRQNTRVQAPDTLIAKHLLEAVNRVLVQPLARLCATLVLKTSLDQVNRVHHKGTKGTSHTAQRKVVSRLQNAMEDGGLFGHGDGRLIHVVHGTSPRGVENLGKVSQAQATRGLVKTGKVEEDIGLHGRKEREACNLGRLVDKLGTGDFAV